MSCKHGNWDCEVCEEIDAAYAAGYTAGAEAALSQQRAVPEGYALVRKRIHPLDTDKGEPVIQLLANSPDAKPFNDPNDYYAHWWGLLCDAAPSPEQEK